MLTILRLGLLLTLACAMGSCAFVRSSENEPIDPAVVRGFTPGTTTARQVVEQLGAPSQIVELGDRSAYRYDHTVTKGTGLLLVVFILANSDSRSDRLWLFFDKENVLTHMGSTFSAHRGQYAMPWEDVHEAEDNAARDAERPGLQK